MTSTAVLDTMLCMPTISRFHGIVITMYFGEHGVPHFHAAHGEHEAVISIAPTELLAGLLPKRELRLALAWGQLHEEELLENWARARRSETLNSIEPLR